MWEGKSHGGRPRGDADFRLRQASPPSYVGCAFEAMIMDRWILHQY
jgi:hypothetical protein